MFNCGDNTHRDRLFRTILALNLLSLPKVNFCHPQKFRRLPEGLPHRTLSSPQPLQKDNNPSPHVCPFIIRQSLTSLFTGSFVSLWNSFTARPVQSAEITVPSLVPTIVKSNSNSDRISASATQLTSKAIYTLPKFLFLVSAIALTKASPECIITFAETDSDTPKPSITIPTTTITRRIM